MYGYKKFLDFYLYYWLQKLLVNFPFDPEAIRQKQLSKLQNILKHAYHKFDFYRDLMQKAGIKPSDINTLRDSRYLPTITKDQYRDFTRSEISRYNTKRMYRDATSGTTGIPLELYRTWYERGYMLAKYLRALFLNGLRISDTIFSAVFLERIKGKDSIIQNFGLLKRKYGDILAKPDVLVKQLIDSNADVVSANVSYLLLISEYIIENKINFKRPRFYISAGELLNEKSKEIIQSVFGSNLVEVYGAIEMNNLAFQLKGSDFLHINHDTNMIELIEEDEKQENLGRCLITDFEIRSFPMIRYELGDYIKMSTNNGIRVIDSIVGRQNDHLVTENGEKVPFHLFSVVMTDRKDVKRFRFIQEKIFDINLQVVPFQDFFEKERFEKEVTSGIHSLISPKLKLSFTYFNELPIDKHGKMRLLISNLH